MNEQKAVTEFDKGNQLLQEGKLEDAIAAYRHAIELNPANSTFQQHLGEALAKLERWDEAVTAFCGAIELKPDFSWSHHYLGDALAQQQKWEQAAEAFRKGIELNPEHFGTYAGLGNTLAKLGQLDDAISAYRRASELKPDADWIHYVLANALQQRTQLDLADAIASYRHIIELNPDSLESYHNFLQVQPDNWEVWLQLAQAFVRQEQMEDAIAAYRRAIALNPSSGEAYHELGGTLTKLHQWEEAIASYRRAIELNPKSFLSHQQLGKVVASQGDVAGAIKSYRHAIQSNPESLEVFHDLWAALKRLSHWEQAAVEIYSQILEASPDLGFAHYYLGAALACLCRWEEAATSYQRAIDVNVEYSFWPHQLLGSALAKQGKLNEASVAYQNGLEIKPNGQGYFELGLLFIELNRLDEAVLCYQKAIEIEPKQAPAYSSLQGLLSRAYHQLGIHQAEQGLLDEALICFKVAERGMADQQIYEQIWRSLNGLANIDESCPYYHKEIQPDVAEAYFKQSSQYRFIDITLSLNPTDREFIEKANLSLENLQLMPGESIALEELYINSFSYEKKLELDRLGLWGRTYQKSLVQTGYIYSICPWTGKIIRSNQSVGFYHACGDHPVIIYRFVGQETFYVIYGSWIAEKTVIYVPSLELIIKIANFLDGQHLPSYIDRINLLKAEMVTCWKSVKSYIGSEQPKQVALMTAWNKSLGHYMWNELEVLQNLEHQGVLEKIDKFLVGKYDYFNPGELFELPETKVIDTSGYSYVDLLNLVTANNYVAVSLRYTHLVTEELAQRISQLSVKRCSLDVLEEVKSAKKHFPILCIQIRSHYRVWLSQIEGTANIIKALYSDFPNLAVVFDGWSLPERPDSRALSGIEADKALVEQITTLLPSDIPVYSAIGRTTYETVVWANAVDSYIATVGSGLTYLAWIANKRGVVHGNTNAMANFTWLYTSSFRENCATNVFIPSSEIQNQTQQVSGITNYDIDWKLIYQEIKNILETLAR